MMVLCECLTCFHVVMMIIMLWPCSGYLWQSALTMCVLYTIPGSTHPRYDPPALISQKYSPWQSFYGHSCMIITPFTDRVRLVTGLTFYPPTQFQSHLFPITKYDSRSPAIDKKPSYSPPGHWEACPPGGSAGDNFTENSIPGWKWLIVFKTELKGGSGGAGDTCYLLPGQGWIPLHVSGSGTQGL